MISENEGRLQHEPHEGKTTVKMQEIRILAKNLGVNSFGKTKAALIREIQRAEGNFDCFGSAENHCDQVDCCFRALCFSSLPDGPEGLKGKKKGPPTKTRRGANAGT
jgi:hypothetical protein